MLRRFPTLIRVRAVIPLLALTAAPLIAQEAPERRPPRQAPAPPALERLERFRIERLQEALELNDEQARTLRESMEAAGRAYRQALVQQREAMERLRRELRSQPVERDALDRALEALENERRTLERLREEERGDIERLLTPEQRAKFLLFNRQFDERLRELITKRRQGSAPGAPGLRGRPLAPRGGNEAARIRRQIELLERRLEEIERLQN
ncbi:MAG TPA: periplasmic heavy metal sensor [Gemmatimonadota bacterium]|nr:periplasmic heavy metal sensor [Gemmatimonadota bacterium]